MKTRSSHHEKQESKAIAARETPKKAAQLKAKGWKKPPPGQVSRPVVQRQLNFHKSFYEDKSTEAQEKVTLLKESLENTNNQYLLFLYSRYGVLELKLDDSNDKNPGDATRIYRDPETKEWKWASLDDIRKIPEIGGIGVIVNIRKWYFDRFSAGQLLAMVAHEVGVHLFPYMPELLQKMPRDVQYKFGFDPDSTPDTTKKNGPMGIIDHQRAATIGHEDFVLYRTFVNDLIYGVLKHAGKVDKEDEGRQVAADLADAYLMDISTFMQSGNRWPVPLLPQQIAGKYNTYAKAEPALAVRARKKTGIQVALDYGELYRHVAPVAAKEHYVATIILALCLAAFLAKIFGLL